jgi:hypothetical protein
MFFKILGGSVHTIKKNKEALIVAGKKTGLEVHAEETKYMVISRDQNAGQNHNIKIDNEYFERVEGMGNKPNERQFHSGRN